MQRNKKKVSYILLYYILAITVALFNKHVIGGALPFPLMLSAVSALIQSVMAAISLSVLGVLKETVMVLSRWGFIAAVVPCAIASGLDIGISNTSLRYVSLSFYTMVKSSAPVFVLAVAVILGLERLTMGMIMVMFAISSGTLMTVWSRQGLQGFDIAGFLMVLSAAMLSGVRWSLTQLIIDEHDDEPRVNKLASAGPLATILYLAPIAGTVMFLMAVGWEGVKPFWRYCTDNTVYTVVVFAMSGVLTFFLILTEYKVVQETSVLTFAITGILKEILLIGLSMIIFGDQLIAINYVGIVISIGGIAAYNWLRMQLHESKRLKPIVVEPLQSFMTDDSVSSEVKEFLIDTLVHDDQAMQHLTVAEKVKTRLSSYLAPFAPHHDSIVDPI